MIKLLYGEENFLINQKTKEITSEWTSPVIFDEADSFELIYTELTNKSLFTHKKELIIKNPSFFKKEEEVNQFLDILKDAFNEDEIIFIIDSKTLPKNNLVKFIGEQGELHEFKVIPDKEVSNYIKNIVEEAGGIINNSQLLQLKELLPNNLWIINNEVKKLLAVQKEITDEAIDKVVSKYYKDDYFALSNAITEGDAQKIINAYNHKKHLNVSNMLVITQVASTLSLALRVNAYKEQGLTTMEIANALNIHQFRIKKTNELIASTSIDKIKEIIKLLAKIDLEIKLGKIDEENAMKLLMVLLIK